MTPFDEENLEEKVRWLEQEVDDLKGEVEMLYEKLDANGAVITKHA